MPTRADQIFDRFAKFHLNNPTFWHLFQRFALQAINAGWDCYGVAAIYERIRWHIDIETDSDDGLKLNNDFKALYARMFHRAHPEHKGFFRLRKLTSKDRPAQTIDLAVYDVGPPTDETQLNNALDQLLRQTP